MKITRKQLRRIIREEKSRLLEMNPLPPDQDAQGWVAGESDDWVSGERGRERAEIEIEKEPFINTELDRWLASFKDLIENDDQRAIVERELRACYDVINEALLNTYNY